MWRSLPFLCERIFCDFDRKGPSRYGGVARLIDRDDESYLSIVRLSKPPAGAEDIDAKTNALRSGGHSSSFIVIEGTHHCERSLFLFWRHGPPILKDFIKLICQLYHFSVGEKL